MKNVTRGGTAIIAAALILLFHIAGCGDAAKPTPGCPSQDPYPDLVRICNKTPPAPLDIIGNLACTKAKGCLGKPESPDCPWIPQICPDMLVLPPDLWAPRPDLAPPGFGCESALIKNIDISKGCWVDKANFINGKADPVKVLGCIVTWEAPIWNLFKTQNGKQLFTGLLTCMKGACPKGGVITFTDKNGVTVNLGFDVTYTCINDIVHQNNNPPCLNEVGACGDDGEQILPMSRAPSPPGGGGSSSVQQVCVDVPNWPSNQPWPSATGILCVDDVCADVVHGGVACMPMPVTTGIVN